MMNWHIVTSAEFAAGVKKDQDIYFLSDTHEIYRGEVPFTESVVLYTELPSTGIALNRLYINSTTLEGKIYNGTTWTTVIQPVADSVAKDGVTPVSGKAVASYVAAEIAKVTGSGDVVSALSWESADHLLKVTKGNGGTENIVLDGVGVELNYDSATGNLAMVDASGKTLGTAVKLDLERFVTSGKYDAATKSIILYFDNKTESPDAERDKVSIPAGDLVDVYTAESLDKSMVLSVDGNVVKGRVKISTADGNQITLDENGLYVAKVDISGKMDKVADGVTGNILTLDENGQAVDSGKSFDDIANNSNIYQGATLEEAITGKTPAKNDIAIVTKTISSDKSERTAYVYNGETWVAFDGNYNAENVYFDKDLLTTTAVGNITLTNGQATIAAAGKNLKQVFDTIFVKEKNPTITQPSVSISAPQNKTYEVGTSVTPSFTATLNPGKYEFNANNGATGITAKSWEVTDTAGHSATTNTGSFDAFDVQDNTDYSITAKATYDAASIVPVTNTGNEYAAGKIAAGSKSATTSAHIKGFRKAFYGTVTTKGDLTSAVIRALAGSTSSAVAKGSKLTISIPKGAVRVIFAYPATIADASSVVDAATKYDVLSAFTKTTVDVDGAKADTAISYKVYYTDFANPADSANTYTVTI